MPTPRPLHGLLLRFAFLCLPALVCAKPAPEPAAVENSVVKVFTTLRNPDPTKPWSKQEPAEITGSGVVIEGRRILTNAHMVLYASQVQVQGNGAGDKVPATVLAVAPGIDLALLQVEDESFFAKRPALPRRAGLPDVKDEVLAFGFPMGGSNLSITKGIISRIEFTTINYPVSGLRIQVDAAINPGNSGGPAVVNGQMVGLVFSRMAGFFMGPASPQGIAYVIPNEEIELFLKAAGQGGTYAKPALFDDMPTLENPALRNFLGVEPSVQGVVVHKAYGSNSPLMTWDVITHIGSIPLDNQGLVQLLPNIKVDFRYQVQHLTKDGKVPLRVVRKGKPMELEVPAAFDRPVVVPDLKGAYPRFFVCGPLVFSSATLQFLGTMGRWGGSASLAGNPMAAMATNPMVKRLLDPPAFPGEELVVVSSPFLPHKLARGYSNPQGNVVSALNGIPVRNLSHLVATIRDAKEEYLVFEFSTPERETLVFPRKALLEATEELLNEGGIRAQGSPDLMAIWKAR